MKQGFSRHLSRKNHCPLDKFYMKNQLQIKHLECTEVKILNPQSKNKDIFKNKTVLKNNNIMWEKNIGLRIQASSIPMSATVMHSIRSTYNAPS